MAGVMVMTTGVCQVIILVASYFKGGEQITKVERLRPLFRYCDNNYAVHLGGLGTGSPKNFGKLDSPRAFLWHSDSYFGADFYLSTDIQTLGIMIIIWALMW